MSALERISERNLESLAIPEISQFFDAARHLNSVISTYLARKRRLAALLSWHQTR